MANTGAQPGVAAMKYSGPRPSSAWERYAACRGLNNDAFYPERSSGPTAAKGFCGGCLVRVQCLEVALQRDEQFGVWGGLDPGERRRLLKHRNAVAEAGGVEPPPVSAIGQCLTQASLILRRLREGATQAAVAEEVGVSATVMRNAVRRIHEMSGWRVTVSTGVAA